MAPFKMKTYLFHDGKSNARGGFSLVEAMLSLGLLSFGLLSMVALMEVGLRSARVAHDKRDTTQIAQTLIEEGKQGTLAHGTSYLDFEGNPVSSTSAAYTAVSTFSSVPGNLTRITLLITPVGAPTRARTFAALFSNPQ